MSATPFAWRSTNPGTSSASPRSVAARGARPEPVSMMRPSAIATQPSWGDPGRHTPAAASTVVAPTDLGYAPLTDPLAMHAAANGAAPAVIDAPPGRAVTVTTFAELNASVNQLAHGLLGLGSKPGERIVWCGMKSLEVITTIHAARKANLTAVPLSYRSTADEMAYVVGNSDATAVVIDAEQAPAIASVASRLPNVHDIVVYGGKVPNGCRSWDNVLKGQPDDEPDPSAAATAGAQMIYTSGTTGKPKGALRTHTDAETVFLLLDAIGLR